MTGACGANPYKATTLVRGGPGSYIKAREVVADGFDGFQDHNAEQHTMKSPSRILFPAVLLFGLAVPLNAQSSGDEAVVRIMNHAESAVRVFVFDSEDRRHELGTVQRGDFMQLPIPMEIVSQGAVEIKVYPVGSVPGLGAPSEPDYGVKSTKLTLNAGDTVDFWIEPVLEDSMVRITRG